MSRTAAASARRLYMFLGGTFLAGGGLIAAACSTDNGTTTNVPTVGDSGRTDTGSSSSGGSSGGSSGTVAEAGADCADIPTPKTATGVYCFGAADAGPDASPNKTCSSADNEVCCSGNPIGDGGTFSPSSCEVAQEGTVGYETTACNAQIQQQWDCTEGSHCPGAGEVCCAIRSDAGAPQAQSNNDYPGCNVFFTSGRFVGGTRCRETQCEAQELQLCSSDDECPGNAKCHSITISGRFAGVCKL
jgi:hypothetical protein